MAKKNELNKLPLHCLAHSSSPANHWKNSVQESPIFLKLLIPVELCVQVELTKLSGRKLKNMPSKHGISEIICKLKWQACSSAPDTLTLLDEANQAKSHKASTPKHAKREHVPLLRSTQCVLHSLRCLNASSFEYTHHSLYPIDSKTWFASPQKQTTSLYCPALLWPFQLFLSPQGNVCFPSVWTVSLFCSLSHTHTGTHTSFKQKTNVKF